MKTNYNYYLAIILLFASGIITVPSYASNIDSLKTSLVNQQGEERIGTLMQLGKALSSTNKKESNKVYMEAYSISVDENNLQSADIAYKIICLS